VQVIDDDTGSSSHLVSFGASFLSGARDHTLRDVAGPLTIRISPSGGVGTLCRSSG
jgi:hypothetical protein